MQDVRFTFRTSSFRNAYEEALEELRKYLTFNPAKLLPSFGDVQNVLEETENDETERKVPVKTGKCTVTCSDSNMLVRYKSRKLDLYLKISKIKKSKTEVYAVYEQDKSQVSTSAHIANMLLSRIKDNNESRYRGYKLSRRTMTDGTYRCTLSKKIGTRELVREFSAEQLEKAMIYELEMIEDELPLVVAAPLSDYDRERLSKEMEQYVQAGKNI